MRGFDVDLVEDLKGYVVKLPRHSRYAAVLKNSVALIETPEWRIFLMKDQATVERFDGKWLILSTDGEIDAHNAVNLYLEKDFIEKVFRVPKTQEEVEPVRHRLEHRVKAYLFICMLAYRLLAVLQWRLKEASGRDGSWESADMLLRDLAVVQRVEVRLGNEVKTWYLNLTDSASASLSRRSELTSLYEYLDMVNEWLMHIDFQRYLSKCEPWLFSYDSLRRLA